MSHNTSSVKGLDAVGKATLSTDAEVPSLVQPPDGVWLWVFFGRQAQLLHDLYLDEVLLAPAVYNELQRGTLYPHLGMEETLCLLWICWFLLLDLCGGNDGVGFCIDNLLHPVIPLVRF